MKASKLVDNIDLDIENKKYNLVEVLLKLNNFDKFESNKSNKGFLFNNISILNPKIAVIQQITNDRNILDILYMLYVKSK